MFIVFEGGDGVGKTTQINLLFDKLCRKNKNCIKTREPGGTPLAERIRDLFKNTPQDEPVLLSEFFLICAARAQHVKKVIEPALAADRIVLCDRFVDSTYVYQYILGGMNKAWLDAVMGPTVATVCPTVTFVLECQASVSEGRLRQRQVSLDYDKFDSLDTLARQKVREGFRSVVESSLPYPDGRIPLRVSIDATRPAEDVSQCIEAELKNRFSIFL